MKLVTWNINSIRIRLDHVKKLVDEYAPDVICFQETKVRDSLFPSLELQAMGYRHIAISGEKSYNGVAILAKETLSETETLQFCGREDKRHLKAVLANGIRLDNFYIPAGGDEPDAEINPKFAHKLQFLNEMNDWTEGLKDQEKRIMVGDFNIAPLEHDVWDHKKLKNIITHTEIEINHLAKIQRSGNWIDAMRHLIPAEKKCFTWWSYRASDWKTSNKGRRLDHVWISPDLLPVLENVLVLEDLRSVDKPSDHAPVMVSLSL